MCGERVDDGLARWDALAPRRGSAQPAAGGGRRPGDSPVRRQPPRPRPRPRPDRYWPNAKTVFRTWAACPAAARTNTAAAAGPHPPGPPEQGGVQHPGGGRLLEPGGRGRVVRVAGGLAV
jgi:hypothetical protein